MGANAMALLVTVLICVIIFAVAVFIVRQIPWEPAWLGNVILAVVGCIVLVYLISLLPGVPRLQ